MKKLSIVNIISIISIVLLTYPVGAATMNECKISELYQPEEVLQAVNEYNTKGKEINHNIELDEDIFLEQSMGIKIPNIDRSKIAKNISIYDLDSSFTEALKVHGIEHSMKRSIDTMTLSQFEAIENTWILTKQDIQIAKHLYSELSNIDMSNWTYGKYKDYYTKKDVENLAKRFTKDQLKELKKRNILIEDTFYLFKEFHTAENILNQSDDTLKDVISSYYQTKIDMISTAKSHEGPDPNKYTEVDFPRYGTDDFLNDVLTTTYWMNVQADRALRTQQVLYNSTSTSLSCTNMYGTYSKSAGGAHEGIDFALGYDGSPIYAVFNGEVLSGNEIRDHQLSVYDADSPDYPKTYTYLHMSDVTASGTISAYDSVGKQGKKGHATGTHVHFEVHSGNTKSLSSESNDTLGSISPYRLQDYIGEL